MPLQPDSSPSLKQGGDAIECGLLAVRVSLTPARGCRSSGPGGGGCGGGGCSGGGGGGSVGAAVAGRGRVRAELAACTTAPSFGVAYQAPGMAQPEAVILRQAARGAPGGRPSGEAEGPGAAARDGGGGGGGPLVAALEFCCRWQAPAVAVRA
jgi:hypothetical protein